MVDSSNPDDPNINLIIPQNLTATAAYNVVGNPPSTRPESGVGNCYPGLEYDHRNLDRRFFPGLLVDYVADGPHEGIRVAAVVPDDPGLSMPPEHHPELSEQLRTELAKLQSPTAGAWFIEAVTQHDADSLSLELDDVLGVTAAIALADDSGKPLFEGATCWRLIRSLRHGRPVTLKLGTRPSGATSKIPRRTATLTGWRRRYTDPDTGVIDSAYRPGELTQSLCSPWTHDFRDCACTYWASNRPDIVSPAIPLGGVIQPGGRPDDPKYDIAINWARNPDFPDMHAQALPTQPANRPFEISYYQINKQWQDLAVVLEGHETDDLYIPRSQWRDKAIPFENPTELRDCVAKLAGLEHLVALLYLYAHYTVITREEAATKAVDGKWRNLPDDVVYMRRTLVDIAIGEMQHLRAANQLLWELDKKENRLPSQPQVIPPADALPQTGGRPDTPAVLRSLDLETVESFVNIERHSAYIDGQYARVTATLRGPDYPPRLYELASTIADEGEEHFLEFKRIQHLLKSTYHDSDVYRRNITDAKPGDQSVAHALAVYREIATDLTTGYDRGDVENQEALGRARVQMFTLHTEAENLARRGIGIPFLSITW